MTWLTNYKIQTQCGEIIEVTVGMDEWKEGWVDGWNEGLRIGWME